MARSEKRPRICLCGECGEEVYARGLSRGCYRALARMVRAGTISWEALVKAKQALPIVPHSQRSRRPARKRAERLLSKAAG